MGYHCDNIYIGPAIKVKPKVGLLFRDRQTCSDDSCKVKESLRTNFCPECGSPVVSQRLSERTNVTIYDFWQQPENKKFEDLLMNPNHDEDGVWLPNTKMKGMYAFWNDIEERTITVSDSFSENRKKQMTIFENLHDKLFAALREDGFEFEVIYVIKTFGY